MANLRPNEYESYKRRKAETTPLKSRLSDSLLYLIIRKNLLSFYHKKCIKKYELNFRQKQKVLSND